MGRGEDDHAVSGKEVWTSGAAQSVADLHRLAGPVGSGFFVQRHHKDAVARNARLWLGGLVHQGVVVERPVCFCVVSTESQLPHIGEVHLLVLRQS